MYKISTSGSSVVSPAWGGSIVLCSYCSVAKLCPTLPPSGQQHARLLWSLSPRVCSNSCLLGWWCYLTISSSAPFSSSFAFRLSQHQGLFQEVGSLYQMGKVLELQLQQQSFQWIFRVDLLYFDRFDLAIPGTLKSLLQHHNLKASILWGLAFCMSQLSHPYMKERHTHLYILERNHSFN